MHEWTGFVLWFAAQKDYVILEAALEPRDITPRHLAVLVFVHQQGAASQKQLSEQIGINRTLMVELVDHLEQLGYVERTPDTDDRRAYAVRLTAQAEENISHILEAVKAAEAEFLAPLTEEEQTQLRQLLIRLL
jgi:DNA-binding MarR family transcriptional regulator